MIKKEKSHKILFLPEYTKQIGQMGKKALISTTKLTAPNIFQPKSIKDERSKRMRVSKICQ